MSQTTMLAESRFLKINQQPIPAPSGYDVAIEDVDASVWRDAEGVLHHDRIRTGVRTLTLTYDAMSSTEFASLRNLTEAPELSVTYKDPELGTRTMSCFLTEQTRASLDNSVYLGGLWRDVRITFRER